MLLLDKHCNLCFNDNNYNIIIITMTSKTDTRVVQAKLNIADFKDFKRALVDLDMTAAEFLIYAVNTLHKEKSENND